METEIIAIGSELTNGAKLDTNSQWLSTELAAVGIAVSFHTTVADEMPAMLDAFRTALRRADVVLITGGLGPTLDDLTRQALAELTGRPLVLHQPSLEQIAAMFARRGLVMPERNRTQALFPQGMSPLPNPVGTAPGIWAEVPGPETRRQCLVAAMPGVPSEMYRMFREQVLPRLPRGDRVIRRSCLNCFGAGESMIEELLGDLTARGHDPEVGITAHEATITLRISAQGSTAEECEDKIERTRNTIRARLGDLIFGEDDEELEHAVVRLLAERQLRLATAELRTAGLLSHRLAGADEEGRCYSGGFVAPTMTSAGAILGPVPAPTDADDETLRRLVEHVQRTLRADLGLAVAISSQTHEGSSTRPFALVALAIEGVVDITKYGLAGNPAIVASQAVKCALNRLRLQLARHRPT